MKAVEKRAYETPQLIVYGSVEEITRDPPGKMDCSPKDTFGAVGHGVCGSAS